MRHLLILLTLFSFSLSAQPSVENISLSDQAYQALTQNDYRRAIKLYRKVFKQEQSTTLDVMRAAAAAQGANRVEMRSDLLKHAFLLDPLEAVRVYKQHPEFRELEQSNFETQIFQLIKLVFSPDQKYGSGKGYYVLDNEDYIRSVILGREFLKSGQYSMGYGYYSIAMNNSQESLKSLLRASACAIGIGKEAQAREWLAKAFIKDPVTAIRQLRYSSEYQGVINDRIFQEILQQQILTHFPGFDLDLTNTLDAIWNSFLTYRLVDDMEDIQLGERVYYHGYVKDSTKRRQQAALDEVCLQKLIALLDSVGAPPIELVADRYDIPFRIFLLADAASWEKYMSELLYPIHAKGTYDPWSAMNVALHYDYSFALRREKQRIGMLSYSYEKGRGNWVLRQWPLEDSYLENRKVFGLEKRQIIADGAKSHSDEDPFWPNYPPVDHIRLLMSYDTGILLPE